MGLCIGGNGNAGGGDLAGVFMYILIRKITNKSCENDIFQTSKRKSKGYKVAFLRDFLVFAKIGLRLRL